MSEVYQVAIIGAGPSGIASAVELVMNGIDKIVLFEKAENHSETIRKFYKDKKRVDKNWRGQEVMIEGNVVFMDGTKESTLSYFDALLKHHQIQAHFNAEIKSIEKKEGVFHLQDGKQDMYLAEHVIIAIGNMGKPNKPSYPIPKSLTGIIQHNLDDCGEDEKIIVVGGGDSAVEYAYFLADANTVTLSYRRDSFSRVNDQNLEILNTYASLGRLELKLGVDIESLEDEEGQAKMNFADGSSETYDRVIYALGGTMPVDFLKSCGIKLDESDIPIIDENHEAATPGLYVAGDIIAKSGGSIAVGLNHAYRITRHIKDHWKKS